MWINGKIADNGYRLKSPILKTEMSKETLGSSLSERKKCNNEHDEKEKEYITLSLSRLFFASLLIERQILYTAFIDDLFLQNELCMNKTTDEDHI